MACQGAHCAHNPVPDTVSDGYLDDMIWLDLV